MDEFLKESGEYSNAMGLWGGVKKIGGAPVRGAYLELLKLNAWGMATKFQNIQTLAATNNQANDIWQKVTANWKKFGGDVNILIKTITTGAKKPALKIGGKKQSTGAKVAEVAGAVAVAPAVLAFVTTSAPIWIPMMVILHSAMSLKLVGAPVMHPDDSSQLTQAANQNQ
jgi:hypothetical protein